MRHVTTLGVLALVAAPTIVTTAVPVATAHADDAVRSLGVEAAAWSWRRTVPPGQPVEEPSNVPAGDLAVAYDGRPDAPPAKATYLRLALGGVAHGTQVTGLTLVVPLDPSVQQNGSTAPLVACLLKADFLAGTAADPADMPAEDCTEAARGVYDVTAGTVSFLLTSLARQWVAGSPNHGVVLRPDPALALPTTLPFQLAFQGPSKVRAQLTGVAPTGASTGSEQSPLAPPAPPAVAPPTGTTVEPAPTGTVPQPQVVQPQPPAVPVSGAATAVRRAQTRAPFRASAAGFAAAGVLGLVLLALVGWSLGEMADPRWWARQERRRLDRLQQGVLVLPAQPAQRRQGRRPRSRATSTVTYS